MDSLKKLGLWIIFIVVLFIGFLVVLLLQCFVFNKNLGEKKESKIVSVAQNSDLKDNLNNSNNSNSSNNLNSKINKDEIINGIKNSKAGEFVSDFREGYEEGKAYDTEYSTINFDDVFLLYEGDQNQFGVNAVLDRLIEDADNNFYSKPTVTIVNIDGLSNNSIVYNNSEEYKAELYEVKSKINDSDTYNIALGFGPLHAIANEIIITRK